MTSGGFRIVSDTLVSSVFCTIKLLLQYQINHPIVHSNYAKWKLMQSKFPVLTPRLKFINKCIQTQWPYHALSWNSLGGCREQSFLWGLRPLSSSAAWIQPPSAFRLNSAHLWCVLCCLLPSFFVGQRCHGLTMNSLTTAAIQQLPVQLYFYYRIY